MCKYQNLWLNILTALLNTLVNVWTRSRAAFEVIVTRDGDPDETEVEIDP